MDRLFLGIKNHVVCLNKETGEKLWETKVKNSSLTNVYYENDLIFAYSGGYLYCLNAKDGSIKWENALKGYGYGTCIIASEQQNSAVISNQIAAQQTAAAVGVTAAVASTNASA